MIAKLKYIEANCDSAVLHATRWRGRELLQHQWPAVREDQRVPAGRSSG